MKLIHKLTLVFLAVALLMAVAGGIQVAFIHEIGHDMRAIERRNVGEIQGAIDIASRVALIGADMNEYLLTGVNGDTRDGLADRQQIMNDLAGLEKALEGLEVAMETSLELAKEEEDETGEASEMEEIAALKALLGDYRELIQRTFVLADTYGLQAAATVFLAYHPGLEKDIRKGSRELFADAVEEMKAAVGEVGEALENAERYAQLLALVALVIGILVALPLSVRIRKPDAALAAAGPPG